MILLLQNEVRRIGHAWKRSVRKKDIHKLTSRPLLTRVNFLFDLLLSFSEKEKLESVLKVSICHLELMNASVVTDCPED